MPKHKVKVRSRWIWTVYYDLNDRGRVTSKSFGSAKLAWNEVARQLRAWLKDDSYDTELEAFAEIQRLLNAGAVVEALSRYVELVESPNANHVWVERTRLVTSRTPLYPSPLTQGTSMAKLNLSAMEAGVLLLSPYDRPGTWTGAEQRAAHKLVKKGLLEQDPTAPAVFRQTRQGQEAVTRLAKDGDG